MKNILLMFCFLVIINNFIMPKSVQASVLDEAKEFNGHYYRIYEFPLTWKDAEAFCESMGGHLATIDLDEENIPIRKLLLSGTHQYYWVGGYRHASSNSWMWVKGKRISYINIKDDVSKDKKAVLYVTQSSVEFRSSEGEYESSFICEWDSANEAHDSNW